ncbi:MAG: sigma 54-interacting transcriptional regulator [Myxococcales bacterium]|nr:sigma 54-interacting transcriptional regulator [Myxococcales bacterium]MCB9581274.1 sigma 54-interacting transcriptional regulator [Polyangiaceae bacterium]
MTESKTETDDHAGPSPEPEEQYEPALLVAYPTPAVLPLPPSGAVVGRVWFEDRGVADSKISREHVSFARAGAATGITDARARNGSWLDGIRLQPNVRAPLRDGSVIRLGRTLLVFRERYRGEAQPQAPIGELVAPLGLSALRREMLALSKRPTQNVLIEGETGSGKELVARAIAAQLRPGRPFAPVNVAGVASGVFESQFFGYVAGAFSGSGRGSPGIVMRHHGGCVFLDEIGELPAEMQPKLLRLLDNRELLPVGADHATTVDVLIIAATNRPLDEMVEQGAFRRDLLARFAAARLEIAPLRERPEDVFAIAAALRDRAGMPLDPLQVEVEAVERLMLHALPANVRELEAVLLRAGSLDPSGALRLSSVEKVVGPAPTSRPAPLVPERVRQVLDKCNGNRSRAARELGVSRGQLLRFLAANGMG